MNRSTALFRSQTFPGLWLDVAALLSADFAGAMQTLNDGLASIDHAEFVERLRAATA